MNIQADLNDHIQRQMVQPLCQDTDDESVADKRDLKKTRVSTTQKLTWCHENTHQLPTSMLRTLIIQVRTPIYFECNLRNEQSHRQREHRPTQTTAPKDRMHINGNTDRSLPTAADYVLGTETIPPNKEGPQQGGADTKTFCAVYVRGQK
jgi:hypothetical protein